jgi:hypothetical protein
LAVLQNGSKYFGIISETEYPLTTQILRHNHLKFISHLFSHSFRTCMCHIFTFFSICSANNAHNFHIPAMHATHLLQHVYRWCISSTNDIFEINAT